MYENEFILLIIIIIYNYITYNNKVLKFFNIKKASKEFQRAITQGLLCLEKVQEKQEKKKQLILWQEPRVSSEPPSGGVPLAGAA